ncbi:MAG: peptidylprolyl isomerase [Verrucomicrobiota bacterium]|nr:peptidylprolyl isomerase [Verrucomicrobiota bacterium]
MNRFLWSLVAALGVTLAHADEVALVTLQAGKEKQRLQFAFEFYERDAPAHIENFRKLARKGFYEGVAVHRVFPDLLVQMGDPLSKRKDRSRVGTGGPGYTIQPEIRRKHAKGAVAAARLPDKINPSRVSNGSQFYVCLAPMPNLDGQYTVFGKVLWGYEALQQLSTKPVDSNDYPVERVVIRSVKVLPREQLPPPPVPPSQGPQPRKKSWWRIFG